MSHFANTWFKTIALSLATVMGLNLTGCDTKSPSLAHPESRPLATVNKSNTLSQETLSVSDQIKLFNLAFQLHELTLSATREKIEKQTTSADQITWLIDQPKPPKAKYDGFPAWQQEQLDGNGALIELDLACSYASRPCAEIVNQLNHWLPLLESPYRLRFFDLPQGYHRLGLESAAAVSCLDGDPKRQLQQFLWQRDGNIDMAALTAAIDLYSPTPSDTYQCLSSEATLEGIKSNIIALNDFGIKQTPSLFVNGEYISRGYESRELLQRLTPGMKLTSTSQNTPSMNWLQSWITPNEKQSWALLEHQGQILRVTAGVNIGEYWVSNVLPDGIRLLVNKQFVKLPVAQQSADDYVTSLDQGDSSIDQANDGTSLYDLSSYESSSNQSTSSSTEEYSDDHQARYEAKMAKLKPMNIPQNWLEGQLMRQQELEHSLKLTESKIEGHALVKLEENVDDFYTTLGMQPGDVLVRINDEWIHENNNTLFQTLANEPKVTLSVMRKGLPVHFAYEVQP